MKRGRRSKQETVGGSSYLHDRSCSSFYRFKSWIEIAFPDDSSLVVRTQARPSAPISLTCPILAVRFSILSWHASSLMLAGTKFEDNQLLVNISRFRVMEQGGSAVWSDLLR